MKNENDLDTIYKQQADAFDKKEVKINIEPNRVTGSANKH